MIGIIGNYVHLEERTSNEEIEKTKKEEKVVVSMDSNFYIRIVIENYGVLEKEIFMEEKEKRIDGNDVGIETRKATKVDTEVRILVLIIYRRHFSIGRLDGRSCLAMDDYFRLCIYDCIHRSITSNESNLDGILTVGTNDLIDDSIKNNN